MASSQVALEAGGSIVTSRRTESVSYSTKLTDNLRYVRDALAREQMHFENDAAFDRYPAFKETAFEVVFRERDSVMAPGSVKKIQKYQKENAFSEREGVF